MRPSFAIPTIEKADTYLDKALRVGSQRARIVRGGPNKLVKARNHEFERFTATRNALTGYLTTIQDTFPSFDQMSEFQRQIFTLDLEIGRVKHAIGALKHAITVVKELTREHNNHIEMTRSIEEVAKVRSAYIGRVSSVMKQMQRPLEVLADARTILRNLPSIDDALFTVAIAGFPNVGKSTLLAKLTSAKPEVKPYAFTTKGLNVGYFDHRFNKIQCIDTPGTLNRVNPNAIELKAEAAIKYLAHAIIYVIDPTEEGYSLVEQEKLLNEVEKTAKTIIIYISKTDIVGPTIVDALKERYPDAHTEAPSIKKKLIDILKKEYM